MFWGSGKESEPHQSPRKKKQKQKQMGSGSWGGSPPGLGCPEEGPPHFWGALGRLPPSPPILGGHPRLSAQVPGCLGAAGRPQPQSLRILGDPPGNFQNSDRGGSDTFFGGSQEQNPHPQTSRACWTRVTLSGVLGTHGGVRQLQHPQRERPPTPPEPPKINRGSGGGPGSGGGTGTAAISQWARVGTRRPRPL